MSERQAENGDEMKLSHIPTLRIQIDKLGGGKMSLSGRLKHGMGVYYAEINLVEEVEILEAVANSAAMVHKYKIETDEGGMYDEYERAWNEMIAALSAAREAGLMGAKP